MKFLPFLYQCIHCKLPYLTEIWEGSTQTNSGDLDQTDPMEQSDLGLHCLLFREQFFSVKVVHMYIVLNVESYDKNCKR